MGPCRMPCKIQKQDIRPSCLVEDGRPIIHSLEELRLVGELFSKSMLVIYNDVIATQMLGQVAKHNIFLYFAAVTCKAYWVIILWVGLVTILIYSSDS